MIKVGLGRVKVKGTWMAWAEIERLEKDGYNNEGKKGEGNEKDKVKGNERNF